MARMAVENLNQAMTCFLNNSQELLPEISGREKYIDYLDEHITSYLVRINQNTLPLADAALISAYFHVVSDIERVGDHAVNIAEMVPELYRHDVKLSKKSVAELKEMMESVNSILDESIDMFVTGNTRNMDDIEQLEDKLDRLERELTAKHIHRLKDGKCAPVAGVYFTDVVSGLERVARSTV